MGCEALVSLSQDASYDDDDDNDNVIPRQSGKVDICILTPNSFYKMQNLTLETYDGFSAAEQVFGQLKHSALNFEVSYEWIDERAKANFEFWWNVKLAQIKA